MSLSLGMGGRGYFATLGDKPCLQWKVLVCVCVGGWLDANCRSFNLYNPAMLVGFHLGRSLIQHGFCPRCPTFPHLPVLFCVWAGDSPTASDELDADVIRSSQLRAGSPEHQQLQGKGHRRTRSHDLTPVEVITGSASYTWQTTSLGLSLVTGTAITWGRETPEFTPPHIRCDDIWVSFVYMIDICQNVGSRATEASIIWSRGVTFQATARFEDSDFFQKAVTIALRGFFSGNSHLSGFKLEPGPTHVQGRETLEFTPPPTSQPLWWCFG